MNPLLLLHSWKGGNSVWKHVPCFRLEPFSWSILRSMFTFPPTPLPSSVACLLCSCIPRCNKNGNHRMLLCTSLVCHRNTFHLFSWVFRCSRKRTGPFTWNISSDVFFGFFLQLLFKYVSLYLKTDTSSNLYGLKCTCFSALICHSSISRNNTTAVTVQRSINHSTSGTKTWQTSPPTTKLVYGEGTVRLWWFTSCSCVVLCFPLDPMIDGHAISTMLWAPSVMQESWQ